MLLRKILISVFCFCTGYFVSGGNECIAQRLPSPYPSNITVSYARTWNVMGPLKDSSDVVTKPLSNVWQSTVYLDGLGRTIQSVAKKQSLATGELPSDLVTAIEYDELGRVRYQYLPFASTKVQPIDVTDDGVFKHNPYQQQKGFYDNLLSGQNETYYYGLVNFENSPLGRTVQSFAPGNSWVGTASDTDPTQQRGVSTAFLTNTLADDVKVWSIDNNEQFSVTGIFQPSQLFKLITKDEYGKSVIEYRDKDGKLILRKIQILESTNNSYAGWANTYYLYDDMRRLRIVIQPRGVELLQENNWNLNALNGVILNEQCILTDFDKYGRLISSKQPGAGEEYFVYDTKDRLVFVQSEKLRIQTPSKWETTLYDETGRAVVIGLTSYLGNRADLQNIVENLTTIPPTQTGPEIPTVIDGVNVNRYPIPGGSSFEILKTIYYDNYDWVNSVDVQFRNFDNSFNSTFQAADNVNFPFPQSIEIAAFPTGQVTGSKIKELGGSKFFVTTNFYNDLGLLVQRKTENYSNGCDIETRQYGFSGLLLQILLRHQKSGDNPQIHTISTKYEYDDLGRITGIKKAIQSQINGVGFSKPEQYIVQNKYDALSRKVKIQLGNKSSTNTPIEELTEDYNIRGWLLGANRNYLLNTGSQDFEDHYFGYEVGYDKTTAVPGSTETSFISNQYNGNIGGVLWKSSGDGIRRQFNYSYDASGRLMKADFIQNDAAGTWGKNKMDFSLHFGDGSDPASAYDANGNILSMTQRGWKVGGPTEIDKLTYSYMNNNASNKLQHVKDDVLTDNKLGDFVDKNTTTTDYGYDETGNLVYDLNKRISNITYNHLDLPVVVTFVNEDQSAKGTITYTYDAEGNKLKKVVKEGNNEKVTKYIGSFIYGSDSPPAGGSATSDVLLYAGHEAGKARFIPAVSGMTARFEYDYYIKDYLGNVRMVLTEEEAADNYPVLTFDGSQTEIDQQNGHWENKEGLSINVTSVRVAKDFGNGANFAMLVRKSTGAVGATKLLKVMTGDRIHTGIDFFYSSANADNSNASPVNSFVVSLLSSLTGSNAVGAMLKSDAQQVTSMLSGNSDLTGLLQTPASNYQNNQAPKAYLNILFFDDQFNFDKENSVVIPVPYLLNQKGEIKRIGANAIKANKNGYCYVYFSNESDELVYFDNFLLSHERSAVLEETHYSPLGLPLLAISSHRINVPGNNFKYQVQEWETAMQLNMYEFEARMYDPQIGRWHVQDPVSQFDGISSYAAMANNWPRFTDPDGRALPLIAIAAIVGAVAGVVNVVVHWDDITASGFSWGKFGAAFGIGFAGGFVGTLTGGAALASAGVGGVIGGAWSGMIGSVASSPITGTGNAIAFGDPYSPDQLLKDVIFGSVSGGVIGGTTVFFQCPKCDIWTGKLPPATMLESSFDPTVVSGTSNLEEGSIQTEKALAGKQLNGNSTPPVNQISTTTQSAAANATKPQYLPYTKGNFRANLKIKTGIDPGKAAHAHHDIPQMLKKQMEQLGINIHDPRFGRWWSTVNHQKFAREFNTHWKTFLYEIPNPTKDQIYNWLRMMRDRYPASITGY